MSDAAVSTTERALENQKIGGLQLRVAALCTLVQICDGYDINSIGVAVPQLTHLWNLPGPKFTVAFLWSSIGIMVGALSAGPLGDRLGRKPVMLVSLLIFGLASLASEPSPKIKRLPISSGLRPMRSPIGPADSAPTMMPMLDHRKAVVKAGGGRCQAFFSTGTAQAIELMS